MMSISHVWLLEHNAKKTLINWFTKVFGEHADVQVMAVLHELSDDQRNLWYTFIEGEWHKHLEAKGK